MSGTFVVSLDFELMWGVRDHRTVEEYGDAVLGGREAIPMILDRFNAAGIRATWATVGLLFAKNRKEMLEYAPTIKPLYENFRLSPYNDVEGSVIGEDESSDPFHYGASLIEKIASIPGQEIASHTYSHYYCMEPGATEESFCADLKSAQAIAKKYDYDLKTIIFPRNQTTARYVEVGNKLGMTLHRGDANGWLYQSRSGGRTTKLFRMYRFLDGAVPIGPRQAVSPIRQSGGVNVPASRFLRPWTKRLSAYQLLHIRRVQSEMENVAQSGGIYHLWWHPHNFGRNTSENLRQLDAIISCFKSCREKYGMVSKNMGDFSSF